VSERAEQLKRRTRPGLAVPGLACTLVFVLVVQDASASEHVAVLELGASVESELPLSGAHIGPSLAVEATPIEDWLELEFGVAAFKSHHATEWETDLLFKKPYTWSSTVEFMAGLGPTWTHTTEPTGPTSTMGAEFALDFMFWPQQKWGWFLEPAYGVAFARGHSQSVGLTFGVLFGIH
jgi:hypothetical protein